jgi:hypothetical protein
MDGLGRPLNSNVDHCMRVNSAWFGRNTRLAAASVVAVGHAIFAITMAETQAEGSWQATLFVIDFPFSLLWLLWLRDAMDALIFFGMAGSAWWFQLIYWFVWAIWAVIPKDDGNP